MVRQQRGAHGHGGGHQTNQVIMHLTHINWLWIWCGSWGCGVKQTTKQANKATNKQTICRLLCFAAWYMQQILVSQIKCRYIWAEQTLHEWHWGLIFWGKASSCTSLLPPPPTNLLSKPFHLLDWQSEPEHPPSHHAGWLLCPPGNAFFLCCVPMPQLTNHVG